MITTQRPKAGLELRGFIHELHTRILQPSVVGRPRLWLSHDLGAHHGIRCQQPQQAELREPTERQRGIRRQRLEPLGRNPVVDVPLVGERHPDVDVREIRCRRWRVGALVALAGPAASHQPQGSPKVRHRLVRAQFLTERGRREKGASADDDARRRRRESFPDVADQADHFREAEEHRG